MVMPLPASAADHRAPLFLLFGG